MECYYINLAHRTDRRAQVEAEFASLGWPVTRVNATNVPDLGARGCALSHAAAIRSFLASSEHTKKVCLIAEDDVAFQRDPRPDVARFLAEFEGAWDVLMLASNTVAELPVPGKSYVTRVMNAQTTSCYAVTRAFAPKLLACFEESAARLQQGGWAGEACCDILWKRLQPHARWYCLLPKAAIQRTSYSDIEGRVTSYGV